MNVHIRWMIRRDMPQVLAVERDSFGRPWVEEDFIRVLRHRDCVGVVAESDSGVAGFMIYELRKCSFEVLNLAVAPKLRRRGIASALVSRLAGKLDECRSRISVVVSEQYLGCHLFLRSCGFKAVNVLHGAGEETGYLFQYRLPAREQTPQLSTAEMGAGQ